MQSYYINNYTPPQGYELGELPRPEIENVMEVLIKVHAASVNPIDVKMAGGATKMMTSFEFPYKLGYDCAGTVTEVGSGVTRFKVGDEVYVRLPESTRGSWSEYAKAPEEVISLRPKNVTFDEAASLPLTALTAYQSLKRAGDLSGKTVFVPAGLSGTGAYCCQLAKNVFKAGKVITTVSTGKIPKVPELLGEGVVDQIIDYTKSDPKTEIPAGSVDFMFDTVGIAMSCLSLMRPKTGHLVSISTTPSGDHLAEAANIQMGFPFRHILNFLDSVRVWRSNRWNVKYEYIFMHPDGKDLEELKEHVENLKLRPIVGNKVHYKDVKAVKEACDVVYKAKGGIGKQVISFE
ncbi:alcohol dehydrogenase, putative [Talaromyces stipitatus ATCC 10500]|uniref:Alcohol dehydrogenase, putative n=1 Tax=Talaromyces stipitatus (strain ATCC 10500 / CBS 375.48 / QM 6759 / NRRL 1006) TaxID=441959 RepID=B8M0L4_TALSN|nr:alcohol dehydrogenase, putative [Talaromyces stipitatus ATCC 10500]EED21397.1 alcohol dehydrogenase, putative [Talaromyces stipitatus ATCC 10500]